MFGENGTILSIALQLCQITFKISVNVIYYFRSSLRSRALIKCVDPRSNFVLYTAV